MSKMDEIMDKAKKTGNRPDVRDRLIGSNTIPPGDVDAVAQSVIKEPEVESVPKKLKGIYLDEDVLEVYNDIQKSKPRGWGSQLVSDLLRAYFESTGDMEKRNQ